MKGKYPGAYNFLKTIGVRKEESVLILTDELAESDAIQVIRRVFYDKCSKVNVETLPLELQHDFPENVCQLIEDFDVIILAASQSWYQVPARRKAKYRSKKRVVECYNLTLEMMKEGALCANYEDIRLFTADYKKSFKLGASLTIKTDQGTNLSAVIRDVFDETGCYDKPGSGGNLPAGEISLGVTEGETYGEIVFDISFDVLGRLEKKPLKVFVDKGRVVKVEGKSRENFEKLFENDEYLRNVAEVGIGTNSYAIIGRSVLEDEKKTGTAHIGFGNDTYFGGNVEGCHLDGVFLSPKITVDGKDVIGDLVSNKR
ncbi:aminopeptidase [bacterium]|nr:aminopeptidase [bacterium]